MTPKKGEGSMRRTIAIGLAALLAAAGGTAEARWITSWAAAPTPPNAAFGPIPATASFENRTLRQTLRLSAGGRALRIRLTNAYGAGTLTIGAARIALLDEAGRERPGTSRTLRFAGAASAIALKGAPLLSDPVELAVSPLSKLSLSLYLPGRTGPCTCHPLGLDEMDLSAPGDFSAGPFTAESRVGVRAFVAGVEVDAPDTARTIVVLGDSISDGAGSTSGANRRWPDVLAERLAAAGSTWGVANQGISGNRILTDGPGAGNSALARLDQDVLAQPSVGALIVFEGVNDLGLAFGKFEGPFAELLRANPDGKIDVPRMIAGYRQIVARAHSHGIKVYGATIAPYKGAFYWSPEGEAARQQVNKFIRTGGLFDGVLDFDAVIRDPKDPAQMRPDYHSGDWLHGSDAGYRALAESIDLKLFGN
jgi:lysophospholipase L1-like esterase